MNNSFHTAFNDHCAKCIDCFQYKEHPESPLFCDACAALHALFPEGERLRQRRGHQFLTPDMIRTIPNLYATEDEPIAEKRLLAHYFVASCDWYLAELDPETGLAFGYADLGCGEWGYFDLREMEQTVISGWLVIDRELGFVPKRATDLGIA